MIGVELGVSLNENASLKLELGLESLLLFTETLGGCWYRTSGNQHSIHNGIVS